MAAPSPAPWDRATWVTLILGTVTRWLQPEMGEGVRWVCQGQRCTVPGMGMAAGRQGTGSGGRGQRAGMGGIWGTSGEGRVRNGTKSKGRGKRRGGAAAGGEESAILILHSEPQCPSP